jgi:predicted GNAT superfamily acetyltransferase
MKVELGMNVSIRRVTEFAEMVALERLQQEIWQLPDMREVTPAHLMITFQKNGGLLLGAYVDGRLVGFSLAFLGETGTAVGNSAPKCSACCPPTATTSLASV